jgi:hypothetical protein
MVFVPKILDPVNQERKEIKYPEDYQQHNQDSKKHYLSVIGPTCPRKYRIGYKIANCEE